MKTEDRHALRLFYQTLLSSSGSATQKQVDFYLMVLKGDSDSRKLWVAKYIGSLDGIDPVLVALLQSTEKLSREDIAFIAASAIAPKISGKLDKILAWKIWPWNW